MESVRRVLIHQLNNSSREFAELANLRRVIIALAYELLSVRLGKNGAGDELSSREHPLLREFRIVHLYHIPVILGDIIRKDRVATNGYVPSESLLNWVRLCDQTSGVFVVGNVSKQVLPKTVHQGHVNSLAFEDVLEVFLALLREGFH
jgi:hypothetical protein